jgi:DNA-binding HxlR family transcriptional regulator
VLIDCYPPRMAPRDLTANCTVARTLDIIGDRWTVLILRDAFYGIRRFDDFVKDLGIARNILAARLGRLVDEGVMERRRYQDRPPREEYRLTEKGRDLLPVLLALMRWGDRWTEDGEPPVRLEHTPCRHVIEPTLVCDHCREDLAWRDLRLSPIPVHLPDRPEPAAAR